MKDEGWFAGVGASSKEERESHGGNLHASDSLKASSSPPIHCGDGRLVLVVFLLPVVVQSLCARLFVASHSFALGTFSIPPTNRE